VEAFHEGRSPLLLTYYETSSSPQPAVETEIAPDGIETTGIAETASPQAISFQAEIYEVAEAATVPNVEEVAKVAPPQAEIPSTVEAEAVFG
jgi:hypothetical protein